MVVVAVAAVAKSRRHRQLAREAPFKLDARAARFLGFCRQTTRAPRSSSRWRDGAPCDVTRRRTAAVAERRL